MFNNCSPVEVVDLNRLKIHPQLPLLLGDPEYEDIIFCVESIALRGDVPVFICLRDGDELLVLNELPIFKALLKFESGEISSKILQNSFVFSQVSVKVLCVAPCPDELARIIVNINSKPGRKWSQDVVIADERLRIENEYSKIRQETAKSVKARLGIHENASAQKRYDVMEEVRRSTEIDPPKFHLAWSTQGSSAELTAKFVKWGRQKTEQSIEIYHWIRAEYAANPGDWRTDSLVVSIDEGTRSVNSVYKEIFPKEKIEKELVEDKDDEVIKHPDESSGGGSDDSEDDSEDGDSASGNGSNDSGKGSGGTSKGSDGKDEDKQPSEEELHRIAFLESLKANPLLGKVIDLLDENFFLGNYASLDDLESLKQFGNTLQIEGERRLNLYTGI